MVVCELDEGRTEAVGKATGSGIMDAGSEVHLAPRGTEYTTNMLALCHGRTSVCSIKARLALAEKGVRFDSRLLTLRGDQFDSGYLKLNPNAVVPTIVHDGNVVIERFDTQQRCNLGVGWGPHPGSPGSSPGSPTLPRFAWEG